MTSTIHQLPTTGTADENTLAQFYNMLCRYYDKFPHDPGDKIYDAIHLLQEAVAIQREERGL